MADLISPRDYEQYCWVTAAAVFIERVVECNRLPRPLSDAAADNIRVAVEDFDMTADAIKYAAEVLPHLKGQVKELERMMQIAREG